MKKIQFPNIHLILGILILLFGVLLLLWRLGLFPSMNTLWPIPVIILGLVFLYLAFLLGRSRRYIFPGMILTLAGLFFLLQEVVIPGHNMARIWPVFVLIIGLCVLPYGYKLKGNTRAIFIIPGYFLVGLSVIFFPFSMGWVEKGFTDFVLIWWPMLLLLIGSLLVASHFLRKSSSENSDSYKDDNQ